jgi:flagellar basal-body rod protein FlgB
MLFVSLVNSGPTPVLERMLSFTGARHRMLVENIANIDTPSYRTRQLDTKAFQKALGGAVDRRSSRAEPLAIQGTRQFQQSSTGQLEVTPTEAPPENILFHDQTNMRVERQMAMLAENTMMHQIAADRLKGRYDELLSAIRGRVS